MYDELIQRLRNCATQAAPCKTCDMVEDGACADTLMKQAADAIEDLIAALTASNEVIAKSKPKWIPVTERLPKDREMVIGFTPCDGFMFVGYHVTSIYHDRDFSYWNIVTVMRRTRKMIKKVTHWMPLPEPPKEE